jgi:hypothetical protein
MEELTEPLAIFIIKLPCISSTKWTQKCRKKVWILPLMRHGDLKKKN